MGMESETPMKKKLIITIIFVIIFGFIGLIIWGRVQYPFRSIAPIRDGSITNIKIYAEVYNLERGTVIKYEKNDITEDESIWKDFKSILDKTHYRQDMHNLFPWIGGGEPGFKSITVRIGTKENSYWITWEGSDTVGFLLFSNGSVLRNRVYHLVEKKLFDELMSFIEDNVEGYLTTMGPGNIAP